MVVKIIDELLEHADNLKVAAREFQDQASGTLSVATTHTQARYALPSVVRQFKRRYPKVHLTLKQETARPPGLNIIQQHERFDTFRAEFNSERPPPGARGTGSRP